MTQVTVALAGDPESPPPGAINWYAVAWEDLQKVGLTVEDDETLADILDHAAEAFGAPPFGPFERPHRSAFWVAFEDGSGRPLIKRRLAELTLLDEHGEATWGVRDWALVPYGQLRASAAAGVAPGDPTRLYFIRQIPQGDLGIVVENWDVFMRCWDVAWNILEHLATVGEAVGGGVLGWKGLRRAHEAIRRHRPRWEQRGATPANLGAAFGDTADAEELARRLGCSPEEAQIIRSFFDAIDGDDELLTAIHRE